jgi:hypothetical protein
MSVSSIASSSTAYTAAIQQQSTSAVQPARRETENDGDRDGGTKAVKAPSPSVNLDGQTVGKVINITA